MNGTTGTTRKTRATTGTAARRAAKGTKSRAARNAERDAAALEAAEAARAAEASQDEPTADDIATERAEASTEPRDPGTYAGGDEDEPYAPVGTTEIPVPSVDNPVTTDGPAVHEPGDGKPAPAKGKRSRKAKGDGERAAKGEPAEFPEGVVVPFTFHKRLIADGLVPADYTTQQVYGLLGRTGFPVKHYASDGTAHDAKQAGADGKPTTRFGVDLAAALAWFTGRPERAARKPARAPLFSDGEPTERMTALADGTTEPDAKDAADLFAAYLARAGEAGMAPRLTGFADWLAAQASA